MKIKIGNIESNEPLIFELEDLNGEKAVSYTHLDVYKRQGQCRGCEERL